MKRRISRRAASANCYRVPWDVYIDERKAADDYSLGYLVVPNTPSFLHKLWRCRHCAARDDGTTFLNREIHWNRPHLDTLEVVLKWIDCVFQHHGAKFYLGAWPKGETKAMAALTFLRRFCRVKRLSPPYNVVVFLDFDCDHAKAQIQNNIRDTADIARSTDLPPFFVPGVMRVSLRFLSLSLSCAGTG